MDCRRRSAVDDDQSRRIRLVVDDDRRRGRWAVDDDRSRLGFYQAQVNESLDRIDRRLRRIRKMQSSAIIPASSPSSASRDRKQFRNHPAVVDDYPPLELPLRWRNPLPDHIVRNYPEVLVRPSPPLQPHSFTNGSTSTFPCDPTPIPRAPPEPIDPLPSLSRDPPEQLHVDFAYQEAHGVVLEKSNGSNSIVLQNSGKTASATIPAARRAFHSTVEEGKKEKEVVSKAKKPTEVTSDGSDDEEEEENRICLQEINNRSRLHRLPLQSSTAHNSAFGIAATAANGKKMIEEMYQKKTQLKHILLHPDTYFGLVENHTQTLWVYENEEMVHRPVTHVPGLYKIFDEILVNVADNKLRDPSINSLKVDIDAEANYNNGDGVPIEIYDEEQVYVPEMIFGHLTSSNYDDNVKQTTGSSNGYGAKLTFLPLIKNEPPSFFELIAACNDVQLLEKLKKIHDFYLRSPFCADLEINNKLLEMYSKCRSMKDARQMLDFMPDRNKDSWHLMINGFASNGDGDDGLQLFENMRDEGVSPNSQTCLYVLAACASVDATEEKITQEGKKLERIQAMKAMVRILHKMVSNGCFPNIFTCNIFLLSLWKEGRALEGKILLQKMNETTYALDIMSCNIIIDDLCISEKLNKAMNQTEMNQYSSIKSRNEVAPVPQLSWSSRAALFPHSSRVLTGGKGTYFVACKNWFCLTDGAGQWSQGNEIHYYAIRCGLNTDVHIKPALITRQATCGILECSAFPFQRMSSHNLVLFSTLLTRCANSRMCEVFDPGGLILMPTISR